MTTAFLLSLTLNANSMENLTVFKYNENEITFQDGDHVMVNATEMAKSFGKQPSDWTRTKSSQEFIDSLSAVRNIPRTDLIQVSQGGANQQGTWFHEDVAIEFARWLSPSFAIWCNDRIKRRCHRRVHTPPPRWRRSSVYRPRR